MHSAFVGSKRTALLHLAYLHLSSLASVGVLHQLELGGQAVGPQLEREPSACLVSHSTNRAENQVISRIDLKPLS